MTTRKHVTLTLHQKYEIIQLLDKKVPYSKIIKIYGIGNTTVGDIKKKKEQILQFIQNEGLCSKEKKRKTMKKAENPLVESALMMWYTERKKQNLPITGEMMQEQARSFHEKLSNNTEFIASAGWLGRFKHRYGIKLKPDLETPATPPTDNDNSTSQTDDNSLNLFMPVLRNTIASKKLTSLQIYSAEEAKLFWKVLPNNALCSETSALKERITFMSCSNATGDHKLKLLVVGNNEKEISSESTVLPVVYKQQADAQIIKSIILDWFKNEFIPDVQRYLKSQNLPKKAILLLESTPELPTEEEFKSVDGNIFVMILPSRCSSQTQPLRDIKFRYRKKFFTQFIAQQESVEPKDVVYDLAESWNEISANLIKWKWNSFLPELFKVINEPEEDKDEISFGFLFNKIREGDDVSEEVAEEWAKGGAETELVFQEILTVNHMDVEIKEEYEEMDVKPNIFDTDETLKAMDKCVKWAGLNGVSMEENLTLRRLRRKIFKQKILELKCVSEM